jgi:hypothetical protein
MVVQFAMEVAHPSQMSVNLNHVTECHIPE